MKCERINVDGEQPLVCGQTAQIYNDRLYIYGGTDSAWQADHERDLWSFDLSKRCF